jgi:hypothetical protein
MQPLGTLVLSTEPSYPALKLSPGLSLYRGIPEPHGPEPVDLAKPRPLPQSDNLSTAENDSLFTLICSAVNENRVGICAGFSSCCRESTARCTGNEATESAQRAAVAGFLQHSAGRNCHARRTPLPYSNVENPEFHHHYGGLAADRAGDPVRV